MVYGPCTAYPRWLEPRSVSEDDSLVTLPQYTVLVVEDDPSIRELLALTLESEGYAVVEAHSGADALQVVEEHQTQDRPLDVMLLDLMLPDMDGLQVQQRLQAEGLRIPVITMSASPTLLGEAMRQGAHIGLSKPFGLDEMLALVATYCPPPAST